jgi:DNA polymerase III delta prime subunit
MVKTYLEKLKDPRWQKKRLAILNRDNFTCQYCFDTESTLHVHHVKYSNNPWDIDDKYLLSLCFDCHQSVENIKKDFKIIIEELQTNLNPEVLFEIIQIIKCLHERNFNPYQLCAINKAIKNFIEKDFDKYFKKYKLI